MLELFRKRYTAEDLKYHLVVPSLPGFTLSSTPPVNSDLNQADVARIIDNLMKHLGFGAGYVAQGGDVGSRVARLLAVSHDACKGESERPPNDLRNEISDHLNSCAL